MISDFEMDKTFNIQILDIFYFQNGNTVFVGPLSIDKELCFPVMATLYISGKADTVVKVLGTYMPNSTENLEHIAVYTHDMVKLERQTIKEHDCRLIITNK